MMSPSSVSSDGDDDNNDFRSIPDHQCHQVSTHYNSNVGDELPSTDDEWSEDEEKRHKIRDLFSALFHTRPARIFVRCSLVVLYLAYFTYSILLCVFTSCPRDQDWWTLLVLTCLAFATLFTYLFAKYTWPRYGESCRRGTKFLMKLAMPVWLVYGVTVVSYLIFVVIDIIINRKDPGSLIALAGVFLMLLLCFVVSTSRHHVQPRPVVFGLALQFVFALFLLRTNIGQFLFSWLGQRIRAFLSNSDKGATFVWRTAFESNDFAFSVLPTIPFFAAFTSVLYYLGWLQAIVKTLEIVMEKLLGTTAGESATCSANVVLGPSESALLIRPFLPHMTKSEVHAVMTGGFATIAGPTMGAFITLGVDSRHLFTASIMSAPASLALSKLVYPETHRTRLKAADVYRYIHSGRKSEALFLRGANPDQDKIRNPRNIVEAACEGAAASIPLMSRVIVNLIAIISLLSLVDSLLTWFGDRAGLLAPDVIEEPGLTLRFLASYLLWPVAYAIGIPYDDCRLAGKLLGLKVVVNEYVSFRALSDMTKSRSMYDAYYCEFVHNGNETLMPVQFGNGSYYLPATYTVISPFMSQRAESVLTYALCGFANFASMGIQIGAISSMLADRDLILSEIAVKALFTGNVVNLLNAATAALLLDYTEPSWNQKCIQFNNTT